MGNTKSTTKTSSQTSGETKYTATPEEQELQRLQLERIKASQNQNIALDKLAGQSVETLLSGGELPGNLAPLSRGIDKNATNSMVNQSLQALYPQFQSQGILDSGTAAMVAGRTAGDIYRGAQEFNIGTLLNLLNLGVGGQASVQGPTLSTSGQLSSALAGLRTINTKGSASGSSSAISNPFLTNFYGAAGSTAGSRIGNMFG